MRHQHRHETCFGKNGKRAIAQKLKQKGVSREIVEKLLETVDEDEEKRLATLILKSHLNFCMYSISLDSAIFSRSLFAFDDETIQKSIEKLQEYGFIDDDLIFVICIKF